MLESVLSLELNTGFTVYDVLQNMTKYTCVLKYRCLLANFTDKYITDKNVSKQMCIYVF